MDPLIGTFGGGFVVPGAAAPFGMVQVSPDTTGPLAYTGYWWGDPFIRGFSHVHVSGMGVPSGGNIPFMPTVGPVASSDEAAYRSAFDHATEDASAGYYRVHLATHGITAELTAGLRVGMQRYTFPPTAHANVLLLAGRSVPGHHEASLDVVDERTVEGTAVTTQGYTVHFVARFDRPFAAHGAWDAAGGAPAAGASSASGVGAGAYVTFDATEDRDVVVKVGISFVRRENARLNLEAELPGEDFGFYALRERTRAAWAEALSVVEVEGGTADERVAFYTALYRVLQHPNVFTDANGEYMGHDGRVHVADGYVHYTNFSFWDTYRGQMQLLALLAPERYRDMVRSLLAISEENGHVPRWALMNASPDYMVGEPGVIALADAWCRGFVAPEDEDALYAAMRSALLERRRDPVYLDIGYVPYSPSGRGASATLEHAIADFGLALVADATGRDADRDALLALSGSWRNVFDVEDSKFVRPRHADGSWLTPFLPEHFEGFAEGTAWQYSWLAPHDVAAVADAMGGADVARERLDVMLGAPVAVAAAGAEAQAAVTMFGAFYLGNQYSPSNEHDLHVPYLPVFFGEAWKTQAAVRGLQSLYRATPEGLPGNDDLGSLSAWFAWSAIGMYPAVAGAPVYIMGSPLFEETRIRMEGGGVFTVRAPGASALAKYVQGASLDGASLERAWLHHDAFRAGGELGFTMGLAPRPEWASGADARPPSLSTHGLDAFGCRPY